jgi:hypothetical protein
MEVPSATDEVVDALAYPSRLWTTDEVAVRPCPVPTEHGIYGWHFRVPPADGLDADRLLYVGIAPSRADSGQTLRSRLVRSHIKGNASGSTLRLALGSLLGLDLRRTGASGRATFGTEGERRLSEWMADNARGFAGLRAQSRGSSRPEPSRGWTFLLTSRRTVSIRSTPG